MDSELIGRGVESARVDALRPGQERVLAVEIARAGFEWALAHACLSHFDSAMHPDRESWSQQLKASLVRIQWATAAAATLTAKPAGTGSAQQAPPDSETV